MSATGEDILPRFRVGQTVDCELSFGGKLLPSCKIVAVLPPTGGQIQYRIKSQAEAFERMVAEHQLRNI
ncbi:MAG: hypothetical protein AB7F96_17940 [Beijerinckiaceae bacterium]